MIVDEQTSALGEPSSVSRPRLAIVVSHPIQHFCPMYRSIVADGRVELLVIFAVAGAEPRLDVDFGVVVKWQPDILEGYAHTFVQATKEQRTKIVLSKLNEFKPDVLYLHGYALPFLRASMRWAKRLRIPILMTTDSELLHPRPWYVRVTKSLVLPSLLRDVTLFLTVGDENERYYERYGVSKDRFLRVPFSIDSKAFDQALPNRADIRNRVRARLGIPAEAVVILTVGKLIPRKAQGDLILALASAIKSAANPAVLLIAGEGSERARLGELARPLGGAVQLLGFVNVEQLPEYYLAADIYAHPSDHDPHPLVISEALYCGLPVVVSDQVGSAGPTDDVQVGRNGWVYRTGEIAELAGILRELIDKPATREQAGAVSRELGLTHSASRCATLFVDGALLALRSRKPAKPTGTY
jgi:glycosyltransferase involved in cell wall biosynthesis